MLVTDAVNEVMLQGVPLSGLEINVKKNVVVLRDEFGVVKRLFTDNDPDLISKMRSFWGDFLQDRTRRRAERLYKDITIWYEVDADEPGIGLVLTPKMTQTKPEALLLSLLQMVTRV